MFGMMSGGAKITWVCHMLHIICTVSRQLNWVVDARACVVVAASSGQAHNSDE